MMHESKGQCTGKAPSLHLFHTTVRHTFWHAIPTSFYIFNVFYFLVYIGFVKKFSTDLAGQTPTDRKV